MRLLKYAVSNLSYLFNIKARNCRALMFFIGALWCSLISLSCSGEKALEIAGITNLSGYIIVSTVTTDSVGGPGTVSLFSPSGVFVRSLYEFSGSNYVSGHAFMSPNHLISFVETDEYFDKFDLHAWKSKSIYSNTSLTASPVRQLAVSSLDGSVYVVNYNGDSIEKLTLNSDGSYSRAGNPFIPTTVGACFLDAPWGIVYIPTTNQIAVASTSSINGGVAIYNADGTCARNLTGTLGSNNPVALAFHSPSGKLLVAKSNGGAIYAFNLDGSQISLIFNDSSLINAPRSMAADKDGYIYIGSATQDTIEKLSYSGFGNASRATSAAFIGPRILTLNPTAITVIP